MANKMLIDATHPEETRVVVVRGNRVEEFDFESASRRQLRGNIYLAKVTRVEPSLQAAFVDYGGNRHGFLAFSEIHPDYYQIPVADRQALLEEEEREQKAADAEAERRAGRRDRGRRRSASRRSEKVSSAPIAEAAEADVTEAAAEIGTVTDNDLLPEATGVTSSPVVEYPEEQGEHADELPGQGQDRAPEEESSEFAADAATDAPAAAAEDEHPAEHDEDDHDDRQSDDDAHEDEPHDVHADDAHAEDEHAEDEHADDAHAEGDNGEEDGDDEPASARAPSEDGDSDGEDGEEEEVVESVGAGDALEEVTERPVRPRRQYKIQEVIKRRQVMLVQVVKEERGTKGAALTTYLSLAGRYSVLMPNTGRGGGISRKITSAEDRKRLKEIAQDLEVPEGMGVILRTAGANRTKTEIKRDFEYLMRLWETVRDLTLKSTAPTLVYEEGSLIKRAIRDLYNKDIDEVLVAGDEAYREAKDFMRMLMPSHAKNVKPYRDTQPMFTRYGIESQLDGMFSPVVQLKSGGYIVLNQTEALVSIDVNSGRATREHHIEDTALKTNLEAAEEVARQLRLRDLAGLIVIDFIDMDEKRNNRAVERKLKDCLKHDRARIQVGRISHFGLLEMSRQRIRTSVLESSTETCPHCGGTGHVRSVSSVALQLLRSIEEMLVKGATHNLIGRTRPEVAIYVLNHKRAHLRELEERFQVTITINADGPLPPTQAFVIERGEQVHTIEAARALVVKPDAVAPLDEEEPEIVTGAEEEGEETSAEEAHAEDGRGEEREGRRRRRRRRRGRRNGDGDEAHEAHEAGDAEAAGGELGDSQAGDSEGGDEDEDAHAQPVEAGEGERGEERRRRRRGRRGGRRNRRDGEREAGAGADEAGSEAMTETEPGEALAESSAEAPVVSETPDVPESPTLPETPAPAVETETEAVAEAPAQPEPAIVAQPAATEQPAEAAREDETGESQPRRRSTVREPVSLFLGNGEAPVAREPVPAPVVVTPAAPEPAAEAQEEQPSQPRRTGWWARRLLGGNK